MKVLVDTCVWSLALRRRPGKLSPEQNRLISVLGDLIGDDRVVMAGPIRQELLSGVRDRSMFEQLRIRLRDFEDEPLVSEDYETAAIMHNACSGAGISGSAVDLLVCAVASRRGVAILTTDKDFTLYASVIPIALYDGLQSST